MLKGIPYFGNNTLDIENKIITKNIEYTTEYDSLFDLITAEKSSKNVIIIENSKGVWLTYIRDIQFNYRDKIAFIPYFEYKKHIIDRGNRRSNFKGHIRLLDNTLEIRYEYKLCKLDINLKNNLFIIYNFDTDKKYRVTFKDYYNRQYFDMDNLYNLYLQYCIREEDFNLFKHIEGYHLITRKLNGITNKEKEIRDSLGLGHYSKDINNIEFNYRDVRSYKLEQFIAIQGLVNINVNYWERKLNFESYLFCITNSDAKPNNYFIEEWNKLGNEKSIIKYGDNIKLIIKDYWIYGNSIRKHTSWSRNLSNT